GQPLGAETGNEAGPTAVGNSTPSITDPTVESEWEIRLLSVLDVVSGGLLDDFQPEVVAIWLQQDDGGCHPQSLPNGVGRTFHVVQDPAKVCKFKGAVLKRNRIGIADGKRDVPVFNFR